VTDLPQKLQGLPKLVNKNWISVAHGQPSRLDSKEIKKSRLHLRSQEHAATGCGSLVLTIPEGQRGQGTHCKEYIFVDLCMQDSERWGAAGERLTRCGAVSFIKISS